jgi:hypothetical protein
MGWRDYWAGQQAGEWEGRAAGERAGRAAGESAGRRAAARAIWLTTLTPSERAAYLENQDRRSVAFYRICLALPFFLEFAFLGLIVFSFVSHPYQQLNPASINSLGFHPLFGWIAAFWAIYIYFQMHSSRIFTIINIFIMSCIYGVGLLQIENRSGNFDAPSIISSIAHRDWPNALTQFNNAHFIFTLIFVLIGAALRWVFYAYVSTHNEINAPKTLSPWIKYRAFSLAKVTIIAVIVFIGASVLSNVSSFAGR